MTGRLPIKGVRDGLLVTLPDGALMPSYSGIRPKIVPPAVAVQDFLMDATADVPIQHRQRDVHRRRHRRARIVDQPADVIEQDARTRCARSLCRHSFFLRLRGHLLPALVAE